MAISIRQVAMRVRFKQPAPLGFPPPELHSHPAIPTGIRSSSSSSNNRSPDLRNGTRANYHLLQALPTMGRQCKDLPNSGVLQVPNDLTWDHVHRTGRMANLTPCLRFRVKTFLVLDTRRNLDSCSSSSSFNQGRWCIQPSGTLSSRRTASKPSGRS